MGRVNLVIEYSNNILPIMIRDNVMVRVANLPCDLTKEEANKIARLISAHAACSVNSKFRVVSMTQTLREQVAVAILKADPYGGKVSPSTLANAVLQTLAARIGVSVGGLEHLGEVIEALEELARLGNGDRYGNSHGNCIAIDILTKLKGKDNG